MRNAFDMISDGGLQNKLELVTLAWRAMTPLQLMAFFSVLSISNPVNLRDRDSEFAKICGKRLCL